LILSICLLVVMLTPDTVLIAAAYGKHNEGAIRRLAQSRVIP
jgi:hypothetical protein